VDSLIDLNEVSPREFEELIGSLLARFGWEVTVTPQTRDGGVDIIGVSTDGTGLDTTWAVECKRYQRHKVGVQVIRELIGVKHALGFDKAVLVTTGQVTRDATALAATVSGIHVVDRSGVERWMRQKPAPVEPAPPSSFASCFLSHSSRDAEFAGHLAQALRAAGVRVWYAPDDLSAGERIVDQIQVALSTFDRLLVVLSPASIESKWVTTEIRKAFSRQRSEGRQILFPISLIPFEDLRGWEWIDTDTGRDLAHELRSYFIPDFSDWRQVDSFSDQLQRLLDGLRNPEET